VPWDPWYLVAVVGSVLSGLAVVAVRKLTETDSSPVIFLAQSLVGFWIVFVPALGRPSLLTVPMAALLLGIGLTAAVAQLLMTWSYRTLDSATGSLLSVLTPVLSVLFGVTLFHEPLGPLQAAGSLLMILSCVLILVPRRRARPRAP
jgi:drug/metabolite transporter (DMT)-like permease